MAPLTTCIVKRIATFGIIRQWPIAEFIPTQRHVPLATQQLQTHMGIVSGSVEAISRGLFLEY